MLFWLEMFSFQVGNVTSSDESWTIESELAARTEIWQVCEDREPLLYNTTTCRKQISCDQVRMREIQGAIAVSAIFQMILGYAGLIGFLLRSISHFCPTFSAPFPNNYQVDHAVDDHPGGGDDWHLALRRGQLLFSGQLGHCHPVRSFSSTSSSL